MALADAPHESVRATLEQRYSTGSRRPFHLLELVRRIACLAAEELCQRALFGVNQMNGETSRIPCDPEGPIPLREHQGEERGRDARLCGEPDQAAPDLITR